MPVLRSPWSGAEPHQTETGWAPGRYSQIHYDDFVLECSEGLGEVLVVRLENKLPVKEEWFVDFVEVHDFHTSTKKCSPATTG